MNHLIAVFFFSSYFDITVLFFSTQVTTVDRFQGQQNDYIILSLVRTKAVGHLRYDSPTQTAASRLRLRSRLAVHTFPDLLSLGRRQQIVVIVVWGKTHNNNNPDSPETAAFLIFRLVFFSPFVASSNKEAKFCSAGIKRANVREQNKNHNSSAAEVSIRVGGGGATGQGRVQPVPSYRGDRVDCQSRLIINNRNSSF